MNACHFTVSLYRYSLQKYFHNSDSGTTASAARIGREVERFCMRTGSQWALAAAEADFEGWGAAGGPEGVRVTPARWRSTICPRHRCQEESVQAPPSGGTLKQKTKVFLNRDDHNYQPGNFSKDSETTDRQDLTQKDTGLDLRNQD